MAISAGLGLGYLVSFSDRWSLVFNLALSIAALLVAGIILVAGAKDTAAIQSKLDELIRSNDAADNRLVGIETKPVEELERVGGG